MTLVPVLCSLLVKGPFRREEDNWVMKVLLRIYEPALDWSLNHRKTVLSLAALILLVSQLIAWGLPRPVLSLLATRHPALVPRWSGFGREFMPTLNECSLLFMPVLLPQTSLTEVKRIMA